MRELHRHQAGFARDKRGTRGNGTFHLLCSLDLVDALRIIGHIKKAKEGLAQARPANIKIAHILNGFDNFGGNGLARFVVTRKRVQCFLFADPVFLHLRGQFDKVPLHIRPRLRHIARLRQKTVQRMAEFMKHGFDFKQRKERRLLRRGLGKIAVVDDQRDLQLAVPQAARTEFAHPRAAALCAGTRIIIGVKKTNHIGRSLVEHLENLHILMINGIFAGIFFADFDGKQTLSMVEKAVDHRL